MEIISLSKNYSSIFNINLNGENYNFRTLFNSRFKNWSFDISDSNEIEIISGVSMVLGADIIDQYNLNIGILFMVDLDQTNLDATAFDIGERVVLIHVTDQDELENAFTV